MIRGFLGTTVLTAIIASSVLALPFEKLEVTRVQRSVILTGAYMGENIKLSFVANANGISQFTYLSPL